MIDPHFNTVVIAMFGRSKDTPDQAPAKEPVSTQTPPVSTTPATARSVAMIGPSIIIKGEVSGEEDLLIEGKVEGSINLNGNQVSVGESGQVSANIQARIAKIDGEVTGDITANEKVVISKSGNVRGNIVAPRVTLEDGAIFKGSIDMDPAGATYTKASQTSQQPANTPAGQLNKASGLDLKSV
jgi:cytoskeletal protein CcmA (bactofilin family)